MDGYVIKSGKKLRLGYTTGACAAAAAKAAAIMLLSNEEISAVAVNTPAGVTLHLEVVEITRKHDRVACAIVKDAGDDPDVTDGLKIFAEVSVIDGENGIVIDGGAGVGRATVKGLPVNIGEAAINPAPRQLIIKELAGVLEKHPHIGGLRVIISVPGGEETAKKTFNPRLGIVGGISILGTTGIVEPMSEKAIVDTIFLEMEIGKKRGDKVLLLTPGNYGADFIKNRWGFDLAKGVKCSNFIGEALDYGVYLGFERILLVGHAGKLLKLAAGIMNTHSKIADGRLEILAAHAGMAGADSEKIKEIMNCATTEAAFDLLDGCGLTEKVLRTIKEKISGALAWRTGGRVKTAFVIFRGGDRILCASDREDLDEMLAGISKSGEVT